MGVNRTQQSFADGQIVTTSYDGLDRPLAILRSGSATVASYAYDAAGRRAAFNGGFSTSYAYDPAGRLQTLTNNLPASTWNNQWSFGYNPAGQITSWTRSNDMFAFAAIFNVNRPYTANGLNQYTAAGAASFGYDANGNLTGDGVNQFTYDVENRLVAASGGRTASLCYDPLGRLYEVSGTSGTTRFLYDGDALAMKYGTDGTLLRRYIHGADLKADDPIAWYEGSGYASTNERILRSDWQGSIVAVADSGGTNMVAVNRYDEYGIPQPTNSGRFQYTGQAFVPELGMYYYKARFYSPTMGRFLQTDPIGYEDGPNWYAYVGNDPVNGTDPSGNCTGSLIQGKDGQCAGGGFVRGAGSCSGNCSGGVPTSAGERKALAAGNADAYWASRERRGDPLGKLGVAFGPGQKGDQNVEASKQRLFDNLQIKHGAVIYYEHGLKVVSGGDTGAAAKEYGQIRLDLALSNMNAIDRDVSGVRGLLSATQITNYHWSVFSTHGLPRSTFGGTQVTGTYFDVWVYGGLWCGSCDK